MSSYPEIASFKLIFNQWIDNQLEMCLCLHGYSKDQYFAFLLIYWGFILASCLPKHIWLEYYVCCMILKRLCGAKGKITLKKLLESINSYSITCRAVFRNPGASWASYLFINIKMERFFGGHTGYLQTFPSLTSLC